MKVSLIIASLYLLITTSVTHPTPQNQSRVDSDEFAHIERRQLPNAVETVQTYLELTDVVPYVETVESVYNNWLGTDLALQMNKLLAENPDTRSPLSKVGVRYASARADSAALDLHQEALIKLRTFRKGYPGTLCEFWHLLQVEVWRLRLDGILAQYQTRQRFVMGISTGAAIVEGLARMNLPVTANNYIGVLAQTMSQRMNTPSAMLGLGFRQGKEFSISHIARDDSPQKLGFVLAWMQVP